MKNLLKVTIVKTTKLQPLELIHIELSFYNVNCIQCFTSMITVVCEETIMIWIFTNSNKRSPVRIILFILKTLRNQQNTCRHVRVNDDGDLEKSTDVPNLLVDDFSISMETTGGYASCINVNNE